MHDDLTIVCAADRAHVDKLMGCLPTWVEVKRLAGPILCFLHGWTRRSLARNPFFAPLRKYKNVRLVKWDFPAAATQRERMLSSFVFGAAQYVETPWHLKLDCVTIATDDREFVHPEWLNDFDLIANPWGYTKPGAAIERVDHWMHGLWRAGLLPEPTFSGKAIHAYATFRTGRKHPNGRAERQVRWYVDRRYEYRGDPERPEKLKHCAPRICSWIKLMRTRVVREIADLLPLGRLPVPSEDTLCWRYCERRGYRILREKLGRYGWTHSKREWRNIAGAALQITAGV